MNGKSIKMYDKQGSVLRIETTLNNPDDLRVYRLRKGHPDGPKSWGALRRGVADTYRRAEVCQQANDRYLESRRRPRVRRHWGNGQPVCVSRCDGRYSVSAGSIRCRRTTPPCWKRWVEANTC